MTVVLLALALAGCEVLPLSWPAPEPPPPEPEPPAPVAEPVPLEDNVVGLLQLYILAEGWDDARQRRAMVTLTEQMAPERCSLERLSAALVGLHLPREASPQDLLAPCLEVTAPADVTLQQEQGLARLVRDIARARAQTADLRPEISRLRQELEAAAAENRRLSEQVESLKAIERSLQLRDRP
ncbi:MAG TPA: hypothetical protein VJ947_08245, partial [Pseudohaliea sp.]|nr:hypothetical protein [Pseudohaliea sp.]